MRWTSKLLINIYICVWHGPFFLSRRCTRCIASTSRTTSLCCSYALPKGKGVGFRPFLFLFIVTCYFSILFFPLPCFLVFLSSEFTRCNGELVLYAEGYKLKNFTCCRSRSPRKETSAPTPRTRLDIPTQESFRKRQCTTGGSECSRAFFAGLVSTASAPHASSSAPWVIARSRGLDLFVHFEITAGDFAGIHTKARVPHTSYQQEAWGSAENMIPV